MRLKRFNPNNIRVGTAGSRGGFPGGGGGKIGCGTIIIAIIAALVFGVDPAQMIGTMESTQQQGRIEQQAGGQQNAEQLCSSNQYALETCNALSSLNETWRPIFQRAGITFRDPTLDFPVRRQFSTGCGGGNVGMGPFYCPADETIYIDIGFYQQMERQMGAGGDFARYYVVAHEYGHHIQHLTGVASAIRSAQQRNPRQANQLNVLLELQADCYAGVWAGKNRNLIEPGDMQEGLGAASAIGDDTIQRSAGRRVNPESFTHGTSDQRMRALKLGLDSGDDTQCDRIVELR